MAVIPPVWVTADADVVDELLADQRLVVPHGVEDLADGQRRGGVLTDQPQRLLVLRRRAVLQPEQVVRLQRLARAWPPGSASSDGARRAAAAARARTRCAPPRRRRAGGAGRRGCPSPPRRAARCAGPARSRTRLPSTPGCAATPYTALMPGHAGLHADRPVAQRQVLADRVEQLRQVPARGVAVRQDPAAGGAAEQLVERHSGGLGLDVPQRHVDGGDGGHGDGPAPPVGRRGRGTARCPRCGARPARSAGGRRGRPGRTRPPAPAR